MPLTVEQVNNSYNSIRSRGQAALDNLEGKKTYLGGLTGNNDTVESVQGAIRMIVEHQIDGWRANGLDLASQGDDAKPNKVKGWVNVGKEFVKAIDEIDGYGNDATLESVVTATIKQTAKDVKPFAIGFGFGLMGMVAIAGGIAIFLYMRPLK